MALDARSLLSMEGDSVFGPSVRYGAARPMGGHPSEAQALVATLAASTFDGWAPPRPQQVAEPGDGRRSQAPPQPAWTGLTVPAAVLNTWSEARVQHWLRSRGFGEDVVETFASNRIAGQHLRHVSEENLRSMGFTVAGERMSLLRQLAMLCGQTYADQRAGTGAIVEANPATRTTTWSASATPTLAPRAATQGAIPTNDGCWLVTMITLVMVQLGCMVFIPVAVSSHNGGHVQIAVAAALDLFAVLMLFGSLRECMRYIAMQAVTARGAGWPTWRALHPRARRRKSPMDGFLGLMVEVGCAIFFVTDAFAWGMYRSSKDLGVGALVAAASASAIVYLTIVRRY
ncbi:MAG: hypothetical protein KIT86_24365 [Hydrogenophaga sp.]|uniref:hypothetical protein n=1 Tax=Hydrogenophaga sp. TaxID=1904254 RepID=UPI0026239605|nr:hypothetical protein [Hydrogenophaga sp.]MCW5672804.1 hypothetical protein [Hydrogenophaga sp.]